MSPLLFNLVLEYAVKEMQKSENGLQLNDIIQLFIYVNNITLLENDKGTVINNAKTLLYKTKEFRLQKSIENLNIWLLIEYRIFKITETWPFVIKFFSV